jgi:hypothetical protein
MFGGGVVSSAALRCVAAALPFFGGVVVLVGGVVVRVRGFVLAAGPAGPGTGVGGWVDPRLRSKYRTAASFL